jgi:endo-1,4-beta-xylanase
MNIESSSPSRSLHTPRRSQVPKRPSLQHISSFFLRRISAWQVALAVFVSALAAAPAGAQVISNGFEDGTTQGWGPRGSVAVTASTDVAHSGSYSLKTTGRTATWNGPALDLRTRLARNSTYNVSAWVRLVSGQSASNLKLTLERTPLGGSTTYAQITNPVSVTDSAWVQITGTLTLPAEENSACTLYLESDDATSAYYMDDLTVTALNVAKCSEPLDQSGIFTDFETGTAQGWSSRGSAVLANTTAVAHTGTRSLSVTGRAASWQGASINALCKLHKGSKYLVSVWVRLLPGEAASQFRVSLQAGLAGNTTYNTVVGNTDVTDAAWVNLTTEYTFGLDVDQLSLYIETANGTSSFYVDDFALMYIAPKPIQTNIPSLKDVLAPYFPIGTALEPNDLFGEQAKLVVKHFSQFTAGNSMKWDATEPTEGNFNFTRADALANFARANGLRMRGHTLLWHSQTPNWVFQDANGNPLQSGNPEHRALLLSRLEKHIKTIVPRYADIVDSWDVVNEVIDPSQPGGLRNSPWLQIIGPDYIDYAFRYAKEVSGDAALFINDYSTEDANKRAALKNVVQGLLDRGVPVDGVGHQTHINVGWPSMDAVRTTLLTFAQMGLMNEVTELDMSAYTNSTDTAPVSAQTLALQGYRYRDLFNLYRELSPIINSVTLWGSSDDISWLKTFPIVRDDKPLLFDEQLQAKPAYWGIVDPSQLPIVPKSLNLSYIPKHPLGQLPERWESIATQPLSSVSNDTSWANFRAGWNGGDLYLQVRVTDATRTPRDVVEVFVGTTSYRFAGGLGVSRSSGASALSMPTSTGYVMYAIIPTGQALAVGNTLKFDVRVTDSSTNQQASWSDTKNSQNSSLDNLGTLKLLGEKRIVRTVSGTPVIDGVIDAAWSKAEEFETKTFVLGTSGATARVRTMWDQNYLYVLAKVSDPVLSKLSPNVWEQDSVEIFVDANNAQTTTYQSDDAQYRVNFENTTSFGGAATSTKLVSATKIVSGGYIVEAAIALSDLPDMSGNARDNVFLGFDVQVNDDGAGNGVRSSVATWNDTTGTNYLDPSQYGVLQLVRNGR